MFNDLSTSADWRMQPRLGEWVAGCMRGVRGVNLGVVSLRVDVFSGVGY